MTQPVSLGPQEFPAFLDALVDRFRYAVEDSDLWRVLWNDDLTTPRSEAIVQAIAAQLWLAHCEAADVDVSREANIGRGPVDFKFSAGWRRRALIEVKLLSSRHLISGATAQLPQYLASERVALGLYVCVGYRSKDLSPQRLQRVRDACAHASRHGISIGARFIDARPKLSASLLSPPRQHESDPESPKAQPQTTSCHLGGAATCLPQPHRTAA